MLAGVSDFDLTVVDVDVHGVFRLPLDDQVMEPGPSHFRGKESAHVAAPQESGQGGFGHHVASGGRGGEGGAQDAAAHHERIIRTERVATRFGMIVKQIGIQTPAAEELLSHLDRDGLRLDAPRREIDVGDLSV
jgi:hypothetical protein